MRTRVKYCGMTRVEDAIAAAELGVDAIGVVMTRQSRRFAGITTANAIRRALPPFVSVVALFMDDDPAFVAEAVSALAPDWLQFHGSESGPDCVRYGRPYLKAVPMGAGGAWRAIVAGHAHARAFLFDGHAVGEQGGSGTRFDWSLLPQDIDRPIVLAGGLTPENVGAAIRAARPYGVDVSSGIEAGRPGCKDAERMRQFMAAVRSADEEFSGSKS